MERGEREIWNKLSDSAKTICLVLADYLEEGKVTLNDLRLDNRLIKANSRELIATLQELQSRGFGNIKYKNEADPIFVINTSFIETLMQTHRLTHQTPKSI